MALGHLGTARAVSILWTHTASHRVLYPDSQKAAYDSQCPRLLQCISVTFTFLIEALFCLLSSLICITVAPTSNGPRPHCARHRTITKQKDGSCDKELTIKVIL